MADSDPSKRSEDIVVSGAATWGRRRTDGMMNRVGSEKLIEFEGKYGLFTPLTSEQGGGDSAQNLEQISQILRTEVAALQQENQALKLKLKAALEKPARTPDDFASAVSHSLDNLQTRLAQLSNPISNFAVREMSLEANVHVDVTPLGTIDYRFVQPGDDIPAHKLSTLKLTLSPIPKPSEAGTYSPVDFTPLHDIDDIQGVGEVYRKKLNAHNIYTVTDLLSAGTRARSKAELVTLLDVDRKRLDEWLGHAELLTVRDIDGRNAEVLHAIGVTDLAQLAAEEPAALAERYNARVGKIGHATQQPVTAERAGVWVNAAKAYTGYKQRRAAEEAAGKAPS